MDGEIKSRKQMLRAEAVRARGLLSLSAQEHEEFQNMFFENIKLADSSVIGGYWPKDREFDVRPLMEVLLEKGYRVALPVMQKGSKVLKFVRWREGDELAVGKFGVHEPLQNNETEYLEPDVFVIPMLAFDFKGMRLGYGGGFYDATLQAAAEKKKIMTVGVAYAQQACLFSLPSEAHDIRMKWVITQQKAHQF